MRPLLLALLALAAIPARGDETAAPPEGAPVQVEAAAAPGAPPVTPSVGMVVPPASPEAAPPAVATQVAVDPPLPPPPAPPAAPRTYSGEPPLPPPPVPRPPPRSPLEPWVEDEPRGGFARFGLMVEAGFPQGLTAGLTFRPLGFVRVWAGPSWDYAGWGVNGGVMLAPFRSGLAPTLSLEAGRFFDADLSAAAGEFAEISAEMKPLLEQVRLEYVAAHVGLEIGSRQFAVSLRAGLARMRITARGRGGSDEFFVSDPRIVATVPTLKLGLQTTF